MKNVMITTKKLGIWMDHSTAHIMEYTTESIQTKTITSKFTHDVKEHSLGKSERLMHTKEQHQQSEYFKELGSIIKKHDDVILFGPTDAKFELLNVLRADNSFGKIKIEIQSADKMTDNQQHAFVKEYFSKQ
ncbi:MAG TPA: hypothetical protein VK835_09210 [Bacteroidia bacterium]|jgi:hypothetical protein|nr:hypothetical protein [Bacteroidia bacterium]